MIRNFREDYRMFYNPKTTEIVERRALCNRLNASIPRTAKYVPVYEGSSDLASDEWFLIDESVPPAGDGFYYETTGDVELRDDGTYGCRCVKVEVPPRDPSYDITMADRMSAVEDGLAEIAELLTDMMV